MYIYIPVYLGIYITFFSLHLEFNTYFSPEIIHFPYLFRQVCMYIHTAPISI